MTAVEDRDRFALANRIVTASNRFVVPRVDARSSAPILYDFEPFALTIASPIPAKPVNWPTIPFRFPSGGLTVSISDRRNDVHHRSAPVPSAALLFTLPGPLNRYLTRSSLRSVPALDTRRSLSCRVHRRRHATDHSRRNDRGHLGNRVYGRRNVHRRGRPNAGDRFGSDARNTLRDRRHDNPSVQLIPRVAAEVEVRVPFRAAVAAARTGGDDVRSKANCTATRPSRRSRCNAGRRISHRHLRELARPIAATGGVVRGRGAVWSVAIAGHRAHGLRGIDDQPSGKRRSGSRESRSGCPVSRAGHVNLAFHSGDVMWLETATPIRGHAVHGHRRSVETHSAARASLPASLPAGVPSRWSSGGEFRSNRASRERARSAHRHHDEQRAVGLCLSVRAAAVRVRVREVIAEE